MGTRRVATHPGTPLPVPTAGSSRSRHRSAPAAAHLHADARPGLADCSWLGREADHAALLHARASLDDSRVAVRAAQLALDGAQRGAALDARDDAAAHRLLR